MKGLLVLLCALAAAQARSTGVQSPRASSSSAPWVVHLRVAVSTSGFLNTCVGALIDNRWVLTSASCVENSRFIWLRYGADLVLSPALVTESSTVSVSPDLDLALININRYVEYTDKISAVAIASSKAEVPAAGQWCGYGANDAGAPGESLSCLEVSVTLEDGLLVGKSEDGESTEFDLGAPLEVDGVLYGVLVKPGQETGFLNPAGARNWIQQETGIDLTEEDSSSEESSEEKKSSEAESSEEKKPSEEESSEEKKPSEEESSEEKSEEKSSEEKESSEEKSSEEKESSEEKSSEEKPSEEMPSEEKKSSEEEIENEGRIIHFVN